MVSGVVMVMLVNVEVLLVIVMVVMVVLDKNIRCTYNQLINVSSFLFWM